MLWYLHLCSENRVTVLGYQDVASRVIQQDDEGSGAFIRVLLRPMVKISAGDDRAKALAPHSEAHRCCFIANSVKFAVDIAPEIAEAPVSQ